MATSPLTGEATGSHDFPLPLPASRFDQKNEMFKRRVWDKDVSAFAAPLYHEVHYQERYGYRHLDYALRNAAWNVEYGFAMGNSLSGHGMYAWEGLPERVQAYVAKGGQVSGTPEENSRRLKKASRFFGADLAGIAPIHPNLVYSHEYDLLHDRHRPLELPPECRSALVFAVAMDYEAMSHSPDALAGAATGLVYSRQALTANLIAAFIRGLGYRAVPSGNDTALSIPLAVAAGLGELGRNGLLISEAYGPRLRLGKVFTDMPVAADRPHIFGAARFCATCMKCADRCPSQSISYGPPTLAGPSSSNHSGIEKWYIDPEKCFRFWARNWVDCSNCIHVCPFNKPAGWIHKGARLAIRRLPLFNRLLRRLDDLLGYGRPLAAGKKLFWERG